MNSLWFRHISKGLADSGTLAYQWHVLGDRYEWMGDFNVLLGFSGPAPLDNNAFHALLNPQNVPERLAGFYGLIGGQQTAVQCLYKMRRADGTQLEVEESAEIQIADNGEKTVCGFIRIVSKEQKPSIAPTEENWRNVQGFGSDFALPHQGRAEIRRALEQWMHTQRQEKGESSGFLLVLGIDHFAMYNEAFGASFCDGIIEQAGQRLRHIAGPGSNVSRIDGDVYGLFFPRVNHCEMPSVARYLINNFYESPFETVNGRITFGASVGGIAVKPGMGMAPATILTSAETAMQRAKGRGRACFYSHDEASAEGYEAKLILQTGNDLIRAFRENRVRMAYQPVMDMTSNKASFHETLIRMIDDRGRMQSAAHFIPAIEKLGLSRIIDQYALKQAIQELTLFPDISLSVNVSNQTLNDPDWLRSIVSALRDRPSVAKRLIVEITESVAIASVDIAIRAVRTLRDLGCKVALDDFGAGYTAYLQLKTLGVDIVKIDKTFTRGISEAKNQIFIRTLKNLADGIDVKTVGEGAETLAEARLLASDGVNLVQGYVFGFPQVERVWLPKEHIHRKIVSADTWADHNAAHVRPWEAGLEKILA